MTTENERMVSARVEVRKLMAAAVAAVREKLAADVGVGKGLAAVVEARKWLAAAAAAAVRERLAVVVGVGKRLAVVVVVKRLTVVGVGKRLAAVEMGKWMAAAVEWRVLSRNLMLVSQGIWRVESCRRLMANW